MSDFGFGIVGLGTMGRNFLLNVAKSGVAAVGYDVDPSKVDGLIREARGLDVAATDSLKEFFARVAAPRSIMIFVPAHLVDQAIEDCIPFLDKGDLVIDAGNSHFRDTERRSELVTRAGAEFLGVGVSGGEEGARNGACIMVGGPASSFERVRSVFERASAKADGEPCVAHVGSESAGHFVKMVHNGIEYGMMQAVCDAYEFMRSVLGMGADEIAEVFSMWNGGRLGSFLVEITAQILRKKDEQTGRPLVDMIRDKAAQKGTGKWTSQCAMDLGIAIPTVDSAVAMRQISFLAHERLLIAKSLLRMRAEPRTMDRELLVDLEHALYGAFLSAYAQGFSLIAAASAEKGYGIGQSEVAKVWRGGCIIRSRMLELVRDAFESDPALSNLMISPKVGGVLRECMVPWRRAVARFIESGVPCMGLASALMYVEAMSSERLPANLLQAQRDLFGAHTYERIDRDGSFHTDDWG